MEAFAQGVPVISTYHAGIPEVVKDGESGFLVPERDADTLAEKLERLIEHPKLRVAMGRNGRRFVEEHYDIDKLNDRLVKIYQQLLDGELPPVTAPLHATPLAQSKL
jgi:colanic acid/amylovoran biosynthesis glycosyltransferase